VFTESEFHTVGAATVKAREATEVSTCGLKEVCSGRPEHSGRLIVMYVIMEVSRQTRVRGLESYLES